MRIFSYIVLALRKKMGAQETIFDPIIAWLGRWCQLGFIKLKIAVGHIGDGFPWRKQCILLATVIVHAIHSFLCIGGGRNGWMAVDGIGWCLCSVWHCNKHLDCSRCVWMTCSTNYTGTLGLFFAEVYINLSSYDIYMPIPLIPASGRAALDDISSAILSYLSYHLSYLIFWTWRFFLFLFLWGRIAGLSTPYLR